MELANENHFSGKKKPCDCLDWEFGGGVQIFANVVCVLAEFAWPPKFSESCISA